MSVPTEGPTDTGREQDIHSENWQQKAKTVEERRPVSAMEAIRIKQALCAFCWEVAETSHIFEVRFDTTRTYGKCLFGAGNGERLRLRSGGKSTLCLVGARGFEPPTPASRTQCATGLRYAPTGQNQKREAGLSYNRGVKGKP